MLPRCQIVFDQTDNRASANAIRNRCDRVGSRLDVGDVQIPDKLALAVVFNRINAHINYRRALNNHILVGYKRVITHIGKSDVMDFPGAALLDVWMPFLSTLMKYK